MIELYCANCNRLLIAETNRRGIIVVPCNCNDELLEQKYQEGYDDGKEDAERDME